MAPKDAAAAGMVAGGQAQARSTAPDVRQLRSTDASAHARAPRTIWLHHLEDEADAAFLYRELARGRADAAQGRAVPAAGRGRGPPRGDVAQAAGRERPPGRAAAAAPGAPGSGPGWPGGSGPGFCSRCCSRRRAGRSRATSSLYREAPDGVVGPTALTLAKESKEHAETLAAMSGATGEPWHKTGAGGFLRNVVYGFNDGLTANFGLVAGMIGAQGDLAASASHAVWSPASPGWRPTRSRWAPRAISPPRASGRCSSTRSRWRGRRSGSCRSWSRRS